MEVYEEWKYGLKYTDPDVNLWNILAIITHEQL